MRPDLDADDYYPVECVLCPHSSDTPEEHELHMEDAHEWTGDADVLDMEGDA